jgi:hypothetical protein
MTLEETFYIVGIVTMTLMLVLMIGVVVAVFIIKSKVNRLHQMVENKVQSVSNVAETAKHLFTWFKRS